MGEQYLRRFRSEVFRHLMRLDMAFYGRSKAGVLVQRMTNDIESIQEFAEEGAVSLAINLLTLMGVSVAMLMVDVGLALAGVRADHRWSSPSPGCSSGSPAVPTGRSGSRSARVLATLQEGITGVRVVQAFTQEERAGRGLRAGQRALLRGQHAGGPGGRLVLPRDCVPADGRDRPGAVRRRPGRCSTAALSFGSLVVMLLYLDWFFQPIINLSNTYNQLQSAAAAFGKLFRLLDTPPAVDDPLRARHRCPRR